MKELLPVLFLAAVFAGCATTPAPPASDTPDSRERVEVRGDRFVLSGSGTGFQPLGFNYDHDEASRLLEDYWEAEWGKVEQDFAEMRDLGATVVRIHLQFGKFMDAPDLPNAQALDRYSRLLDLADRTGLRLDVTGLGCYRKRDVPAWYDALGEAARWEAQAAFWTAVASRGKGRAAIFCYDIMNEPVVPGVGDTRPEWLGPPFGDPDGYCFVQFVTLSTTGRPRAEVATAWLRRLSSAIRSADPGALVTCGFTDWSLDKPGLTTGFTPAQAAPELDFLCVHLYPQSRKLDESLSTLRAFAAAGKPVVVEETFALKCSAAEWLDFTKIAGTDAAGWVGFYWGKSIEECRRDGTIVDMVLAEWLEAFRELRREQSGRK